MALGGASADEARYRALSLWWDGVEGPITPRPSLGTDIDVDVAIVGAGFTGLWTALSLLAADGGMRVALLEAEVAGFGASGRNGGWCSALFAASDSRLARDHGTDAARAMRRAMQRSVDEVASAVATEGIDCRLAKGGTLVAARNAAQVSRAKGDVAEARSLGFGEEDLRWLDGPEAEERLGAQGVLGATFTPHCAALDPARLARARQGRGAPGCHPLRADCGHSDPGRAGIEAGARANTRRDGPCGRRRTGARGMVIDAPRPASVARAAVLPHDRDRAPG